LFSGLISARLSFLGSARLSFLISARLSFLISSGISFEPAFSSVPELAGAGSFFGL